MEPRQTIPLAERMRPQNLADVVGQSHLIGVGKIIREIIAQKQPTSLILWGPPGSGKTTLARIIAHETHADFIEISAVTAGKTDIVNAIKHAKENKFYENARKDASKYIKYTEQESLLPQEKQRDTRTILFIDEIHRFNKAQQDTLLPHVEDGTIILIGATTENPSFEVITPLLSRSRVLVLEPLTKDDIIAILTKAAKMENLSVKQLPKASIAVLAELSGGDARVALGNLELAMRLARDTITPEVVRTAAQKRVPGYDKNGENHYNIISAFIKSMRGSDVTAALYYMARMLAAGEDPKFIARRMVIFASEDIGLAGNGALSLAVATFEAVERIGMPECQYNLYHCAVALARSKKSRGITNVMHAAQTAAREYPDLPVPLHLRNAPTKLMGDLGYQEGYKWEAGFEHDKGFLPSELEGIDFFTD